MRRRPALTVDVGDRGGGPPPAASSPAPPRAVAGVRASVQLSFCDDGRLKLPGGAGGGGAVCQVRSKIGGGLCPRPSPGVAAGVAVRVKVGVEAGEQRG